MITWAGNSSIATAIAMAASSESRLGLARDSVKAAALMRIVVLSSGTVKPTLPFERW